MCVALRYIGNLKEIIMARLVKRFRNKPYPVTIGGETQYICGCGLSANQPFCDGTHKATSTEAPGKLYWYDEDRQRHEAADSYPGIRSDRQTAEA
jgi:CDGSH-type Zn-finger protein